MPPAPSHQITENDGYCKRCEDGGDLYHCDGCPSSYHLECVEHHEYIGITNDDSNWYCPDCVKKGGPAVEAHLRQHPPDINSVGRGLSPTTKKSARVRKSREISWPRKRKATHRGSRLNIVENITHSPAPEDSVLSELSPASSLHSQSGEVPQLVRNQTSSGKLEQPTVTGSPNRDPSDRQDLEHSAASKSTAGMPSPIAVGQDVVQEKAQSVEQNGLSALITQQSSNITKQSVPTISAEDRDSMFDQQVEELLRLSSNLRKAKDARNGTQDIVKVLVAQKAGDMEEIERHESMLRQLKDKATLTNEQLFDARYNLEEYLKRVHSLEYEIGVMGKIIAGIVPSNIQSNV